MCFVGGPWWMIAFSMVGSLGSLGFYSSQTGRLGNYVNCLLASVQIVILDSTDVSGSCKGW